MPSNFYNIVEIGIVLDWFVRDWGKIAARKQNKNSTIKLGKKEIDSFMRQRIKNKVHGLDDL